MDEALVERYRQLYTAVGQMTMRWAGLEMATDGLVAAIFRTLPPGTTDFPRALNRKTKFLRRQFNQMVEIRPFAPDGIRLADRIDQAAHDRKWIIHGAMADMPEFEQAGEIRITRTSYDKIPLRMEYKTISIAEIDGYSVQFSALMNETGRLADAIFHSVKEAGR